MISCRGWIDDAQIVGDTLKIHGWVATRGAGAVEGFQVACAGQALTVLETELGLPSPDISTAFPDLDQAEHCRFRIRARLDAATPERARTSVLTCTPLAGGQQGPLLAHVIERTVPIPSEEDLKIIGGGFFGYSNDFLGYLIQLAGLKPNSHVLDVGCGVGRMGVWLAQYLEPTARYEGFDTIEPLVRWADQQITPRAPHIRFQHVNLFNKAYNPTGTIKPSEFRFPYADESFDLIFLSSVFTHMFADDLRHYLDEMQRVLRPGGRCLTTWFLRNEESRATLHDGRSALGTIHSLGDCYTASLEAPEWAIVFDESKVLEWIEERGFALESKSYGTWCGLGTYTNGQDILVLQKKASGVPDQQKALRFRGDGQGGGLAGLLRGIRKDRRAVGT